MVTNDDFMEAVHFEDVANEQTHVLLYGNFFRPGDVEHHRGQSVDNMAMEVIPSDYGRFMTNYVAICYYFALTRRWDLMNRFFLVV